MTVHEGVEITTVRGSPRLHAVTLRAFNLDNSSKDTMPDNPLEILRSAAAFVFIDADPGCTWLPDSIARDNLGYTLKVMPMVHTLRRYGLNSPTHLALHYINPSEATTNLPKRSWMAALKSRNVEMATLH